MASGWRVVSQRAVERYQPSGHFEDVVEVQIVTDSGTYKTFAIPEAAYTPDNVKAVIEDWVARSREVENL